MVTQGDVVIILMISIIAFCIGYEWEGRIKELFRFLAGIAFGIFLWATTKRKYTQRCPKGKHPCADGYNK